MAQNSWKKFKTSKTAVSKFAVLKSPTVLSVRPSLFQIKQVTGEVTSKVVVVVSINRPFWLIYVGLHNIYGRCVYAKKPKWPTNLACISSVSS